jgi:predicted nuclease with TOPRIM domain
MTIPKRHPKRSNAISKTVKNADPLSSLRTKLKAAEPEIQNYVTALEAENLKLQKQIAKLQAENITLNNRIKTLEEENLKPKVNIEIVKFSNHNSSQEKE